MRLKVPWKRKKARPKLDLDSAVAVSAGLAYAVGVALRHRGTRQEPRLTVPSRTESSNETNGQPRNGAASGGSAAKAAPVERTPERNAQPDGPPDHSAPPPAPHQKLRLTPKTVWKLLKDTWNDFNEDKVLRLSAALSYYAIFSLGPLLLIVVGVAGWVLGGDAVRHQVEEQLRGIFGDSSARIVESMMAARSTGTSIVTTIVGAIVLLSGAGGVFGQLQDSLNTIWEVQPKPGRGIKGMLRDRFLSWAMVLGIGFLLLVSMVLSAALAATTHALGARLSIPAWLGHSLNVLVSFGVVTVLFAMIFKFLPDVRIPWRNVWGGAAGTALLFAIGKVLLGFYLGRTSTTSPYGAAGSVVLILLWVYYASVILFFGAEFTQAYTRAAGVTVQPTANAVPVEQRQREEQGMKS